MSELRRNPLLARAKVSATIDREIVRWIDEQVKAKKFRNRSHAIEWALDKAIEDETKERRA